MTSQQRRHHIDTARELARELRFASRQFDESALRDLGPTEFWTAMQPEAELVARFRRFLEKLWFDGIRSRFFADFDASKLILPIAPEIAERLDSFAEDLEIQASASGGSARHPRAAELRIER